MIGYNNKRIIFWNILLTINVLFSKVTFKNNPIANFALVCNNYSDKNNR